MDEIDRAIINRLQESFPIVERPYLKAAQELGIGEQDLIQRLKAMLDKKQLTRFGPLFHAERLGGGLSLCAIRVPADDFERVNELVNQFPEVAHNYARDHEFSMWFVLATETPQRIESVILEIEQTTGYRVYNMPKEQEFFVGLKFEV